jgi:hypothetical protein
MKQIDREECKELFDEYKKNNKVIYWQWKKSEMLHFRFL